MELHVDRCKSQQTGHRLICACNNIILIESTGTCKHHIRLDNVSCEQSTASFTRDDKKVNAPSDTPHFQYIKKHLLKFKCGMKIADMHYIICKISEREEKMIRFLNLK